MKITMYELYGKIYNETQPEHIRVYGEDWYWNDYDGYVTKESLKTLIDELVHYSNLGRVANTTEKIYENQGKSFNILHEEIVYKEV